MAETCGQPFGWELTRPNWSSACLCRFLSGKLYLLAGLVKLRRERQPVVWPSLMIAAGVREGITLVGLDSGFRVFRVFGVVGLRRNMAATLCPSPILFGRGGRPRG